MDLLSYLTAKDMDTGNFAVKKMIILGTDQLCYLTAEYAEYAEGAEGDECGQFCGQKKDTIRY